jgi:maltokinase
VVARDEAGRCATLPIVRSEREWRLADARDGLSERVVQQLAAAADPVTGTGSAGFRLERYLPVSGSLEGERRIGADQTNRSVVVGSGAIVKWRTSADADGERSTILRRHLQARGFAGMAPLLGSLRWTGPDGRTWTLADIDGFLPGASDGWDHDIGVLQAAIGGSPVAVQQADHIGPSLGALTATMHATLAVGSGVIPDPVHLARADEVAAWHRTARASLDAALSIVAPDQERLSGVSARMADEIETLTSIDACVVQPIHGDLHLGQTVPWADGLAYIDFDGAPSTEVTGRVDRQPTARDVAQLRCSLDNLAAVVAARSSGRASAWLRGWARRTRTSFLVAYRAGLASAGTPSVLDERLLPAFEAEQFCRELIYAAEVLPRWRYAPMTALLWRYGGAGT